MNPKDWMKKAPGGVGVLGSGLSGRAAASLARAKGLPVEVFDEQEDGSSFASVEDGRLQERCWVVSPGFAFDHPWCERIRSLGGTLIPELEFGAMFLRGELMVITGSLGKTSMVLLTAELLRRIGKTVSVSGNIGVPVSEVAEKTPVADFHVIEASSFQLETLDQLRPDRAVCLNLFPNHLDRHPTMQAYAQAKANLFRRMTGDDVAAWPDSFPVPVNPQVTRKFPALKEMPPLKDTPFESGPLRENLAMILAVLDDLPGMDAQVIDDTVSAFRFPDHRLQELDLPGLGRVIDDSKSTCFAATRAALGACPGRPYLIMGGLDKAQDPEELVDLFVQRNPYLYVFGASGKKMQKAWQDSVDVCVFEDTLENLMNALFTHRKKPDEPVIFSPGCASFDQFESFAARGRMFQQLCTHFAKTLHNRIQNPTT